MGWTKQLFSSSIGRKFAMALSAFFLLIFLLQHFTINVTSTFGDGGKLFNQLSHFMGTNPLVQFALQPVLLFGVVFHFVMGFVLEIQNKRARGVNYAKNNGSANASWMSRNMIYSGLVILFFMGLHFYDFWFPEINYKYIAMNEPDATRYYGELVHKFESPVRVGIYVLAFVFLSLHLLHGFQSAFQTVGANHPKYTPGIKKLSTLYAVLIPAGFIFIALFHHFNSH